MKRYAFRAAKVHVNAFVADGVLAHQTFRNGYGEECQKPEVYCDIMGARQNGMTCQTQHEAVVLPLGQFLDMGGSEFDLTRTARETGSGNERV